MTKFFRRLSKISPQYGALLLVFFFSTLPYWSSLNFPFLLEWDDGRYLSCDQNLELTFHNIWHQLTHTQLGLYTPLPMISLMIDWALGGMNPLIFHLHNILLLGLLSCGLFLIMRCLQVRTSVALLGALIWAILPARIESVAWIAERKDLTSGLFAITTMYFFLHAVHQRRYRILAGIFYLLAGLSKPTTLPLLGLMMLYAWHRERRLGELWKILWTAITSFVVLIGIYSAFMLTAVSRSLDQSVQNSDYAMAILRFWRYMSSTILPGVVNPIHPRQVLDPWCWPLASTGLILIGLLYLLARRLEISREELALWGLGLIGMWLPLEFSGNLSNVDFADRYTILLSALMWTFLATLAELMLQKKPTWSRNFHLLAMLWVLFISFFTIKYLPVFSDSAKLFNYALDHNTAFNLKAAEGLAQVGYNRRNPQLLHKSGAYLLQASTVESNPRNQRVYFNMGSCFAGEAAWQRGDLSAACQLLLPPLSGITPPEILNSQEYLGAWYLSGSALFLQLKRPDQAIRLLQVMINHKLGRPHEQSFAQGLWCYLRKDFKGARQHWEHTLHLNPQDHQVRYNLQQLQHQAKF